MDGTRDGGVDGMTSPAPTGRRRHFSAAGLNCGWSRVLACESNTGPAVIGPDRCSQDADCRGMRHPSLLHPPGSLDARSAPHQLCPVSLSLYNQALARSIRGELPVVLGTSRTDDDVTSRPAMASFIHLTIRDSRFGLRTPQRKSMTSPPRPPTS